MGWKETCAVKERMRFMVAVEKREESFAAICRRFGVSRRVGYKWLDRFEEEGACGLLDRSRAPRHHPQAMKQETAERCLQVRRTHPTWGPLKVRAYLERKVPTRAWPAASSIGELFDLDGLADDCAADGEHDRRAVRSRGPDGEATVASPQPAVERAFCPLRCRQRCLVHRLQGLVFDR